MMLATTDPLEKVIRDAGEDWLIDSFSPPDKAIEFLAELLKQADTLARQRLGNAACRVTSEAIVKEYERNPHKVRAFLQVLGATRSPDILLMVWRILQGMEIVQIQMEYRLERVFSLRVGLATSGGDQVLEEYHSTDIDDAVVLRHLGIMKMNEKPVFDGFYTMRLK